MMPAGRTRELQLLARWPVMVAKESIAVPVAIFCKPTRSQIARAFIDMRAQFLPPLKEVESRLQNFLLRAVRAARHLAFYELFEFWR